MTFRDWLASKTPQAKAVSAAFTADKTGSTYLACEKLFAAAVRLGRELEARDAALRMKVAINMPLGTEQNS